MMLYSASGELRPEAPFDLSPSLAVIEASPALRDVVATDTDSLSTVVFAGGQPTHVTVVSAGHVETPRLVCRLVSNHPLGEYARIAALSRVRSFLSLDDDLRFFYQLGREDAHFSSVIERLDGYHQVKFPTPFEAACWAALGGLASPSAAARLHARLVACLGPRVDPHVETPTAFPDPVRVLDAKPGDLGRPPISDRRWRTLRDLAAAFGRVDGLFLREAPLGEIDRWLRRIDGIGPAAARFTLVHGAGRLDAFRLDEPGLRDSFLAAYGKGAGDVEGRIATAARHYGPWRGYWAHYLAVDRLLGTRSDAAQAADAVSDRRRRPRRRTS